MMLELGFVIVVGTSVGVLIDALTLGVRKGMIKGFFDMGPAGWFFSNLGLWIVAFPAYLVKRDEYKRVIAPGKAPQGDSPLDQVERLAALKTRGLVTEEEFETKKRELLSRI
jgi:hypothetical protein